MFFFLCLLHPGHGSSLIICVGILTGYTDTLHKMITQFSGYFSRLELVNLELIKYFMLQMNVFQ